MGRRKIPIRRILKPRDQQSTFSKRKVGLLKKAFELCILTGCDVGLVILRKGKLVQYSSEPMEHLLEKYWDHRNKWELQGSGGSKVPDAELWTNKEMKRKFQIEQEEEEDVKAESGELLPLYGSTGEVLMSRFDGNEGNYCHQPPNDLYATHLASREYSAPVHPTGPWMSPSITEPLTAPQTPECHPIGSNIGHTSTNMNVQSYGTTVIAHPRSEYHSSELPPAATPASVFRHSSLVHSITPDPPPIAGNPTIPQQASFYPSPGPTACSASQHITSSLAESQPALENFMRMEGFFLPKSDARFVFNNRGAPYTKP